MTVHSKVTSKIDLAPVSDYMQKDVATLRADATTEEAVALFEEYHISGAPVVNSSDELVGVLSASDIARSDHLTNDLIQTERPRYFLRDSPEESLNDVGFDQVPFPQDAYSSETMDCPRVKDWMNPTIISVKSSLSVQEACRLMVRESIHRVLVVENDKLLGIFSSFDVVRALAQ